MKARAVDRRIQRTRQLLHGSLMVLIQEKGFEALSVQDIIDRANVGRATFYAHFDSKEDLLASGIENLRESLKERQRQARSAGGSDERLFAFSRELFTHAPAFPLEVSQLGPGRTYAQDRGVERNGEHASAR